MDCYECGIVISLPLSNCDVLIVCINQCVSHMQMSLNVEAAAEQRETSIKERPLHQLLIGRYSLPLLQLRATDLKEYRPIRSK